jgi:RimJ/RimL family protein N-acetyltransferase
MVAGEYRRWIAFACFDLAAPHGASPTSSLWRRDDACSKLASQNMQIKLINAQADDLLRPWPRLTTSLAANFPQGTQDIATVLSTITTPDRPSPWTAYWGTSRREIVGLCAFKAPPDAEGMTEIAYYTFPRLEGRGIATGMARALVALARNAGASAVLANTLPVQNASGAILSKLGFAFLGEANDPEDGTVWAWRLRLTQG